MTLLKTIKGKGKGALDVKDFPVVRSTLPCIFNDLPLGIKIGSVVELDLDDLIMSEDSLLAPLDLEVSNYVRAFSSFELFEQQFFLFYLEGRYSLNESILQVTIDEEGEIQQKIFVEYSEDPLEDEEEWIGDGGYIGALTFTVEEDIEFQRSWGGEGEDVDPYLVEETIYRTNYGENLVVDKQLMLYHRDIGEGIEHLLVTADDYKGETHIRIYNGIDTSIVVI